MRSLSKLGTAATVATLLAGCSTTHLATQWVNPDQTDPPIRRLLVAAPSARSAADRINFEQRLSEQLRAETRAEVTSLYELVPELGELSEDQLKRALDDGDFDAVLVVRWLDRRQKLDVTSSPTSFGYGLWYRSYFLAERDRLRAYEVLSLESNLHRMPGFELAWSGRTESVDIDSPTVLAQELGDVVAKALVQAGLLTPSE